MKHLFLFFILVCSIINSIAVAGENRIHINAEDAAKIWLKDHGFKSVEFTIKPRCSELECEIVVHPLKVEDIEISKVRGCPFKLCVTLTYSVESNSIIKSEHLR